MKLRRKPDHEAISVRIEADDVEEPEYIPLRKTHGGMRTVAKGDVEVDIFGKLRRSK